MFHPRKGTMMMAGRTWMKSRAAAMALLFGMPVGVQAAPACRVPPNLAPPQAEYPTASQMPRVVPITSYTLALLWTPQHCFKRVTGAESLGCGREATGFVLHGLWPDGANGSWPQWCAAAAILPRATIAAHYCATPSAQLLQHEWAKHGTCMAGETPDSYFAKAARLYNNLRFPDMARLATAPTTEAAFAAAFADANRGITSDMIRLNLDKQGWLQEVWFCLDTAFRPERCAAPRQPMRVVRIRPSV